MTRQRSPSRQASEDVWFAFHCLGLKVEGSYKNYICTGFKVWVPWF